MLAPKSHPSLKLLFLLAQMIQVTRYTFNAAMKNDLKILIFLLCDIPLITAAYYYDNIMRQHLKV